MSFNEKCPHLDKLHMQTRKIPNPVMGEEDPVYIKMYWCDGIKKFVEDCPDPCNVIDQ